MIERRDVELAWNSIAHQFDPIHGDSEGDALLRNPDAERAGIRSALDHIELVDRIEGGALEGLGYQFVRDETVWSRASEAVFQARALQQILHWIKLNPEDAPALDNVVVRQTFSTSFAFATPQHVAVGAIHFVVIPFVYTELLMMSAKALNEMLAGDEAGDAWAAMASGKPWDATQAPGALRQLIARMLSDHAFHAAEPGENAMSRLQAASGWLRRDESREAPGALETHLSYAALDFAIAHEIGHRVIQFAKPDTPSGPMLEEAADLIAIRLFAGSWGWRDDIFDGCPLGDGGRILLGPIWFFYSAQLLFMLRALLAARVVAIAPQSPLAATLRQRDRHLTKIIDRWSNQQTLLAQLSLGFEAFGAPMSQADGQILGVLATALETLTEAVPRWIGEIPDEDLAFAAAMPAI